MNLRDFQRDVGAWHRAEFGDRGDAAALCRKLYEECREFLFEPSVEEAADIVLVLLAWADRQGADLSAALLAKFAIVRERDQLGRDVAKGVVR